MPITAIMTEVAATGITGKDSGSIGSGDKLGEGEGVGVSAEVGVGVGNVWGDVSVGYGEPSIVVA
jgi:hypothetical protein